MRLQRRFGALFASAIACVGVIAAPTAARAASCASASPDGGEWSSYGHDIANTRSQPDEHDIGVDNVATVTKQWSVDALDDLGDGEVTSTPVVSDGCVFVVSSVTNGAELFAYNADDGTPVWNSGQLRGGGAALGGAGVGSPAVGNGRIFALVSAPDHPYAVAYDLAGNRLWGGGPQAAPNTNAGFVDDQPFSFINASAVVIPSPSGDMLFAGFAAEENEAAAGRGGWTIFDAASGDVLAHEFSIDDAEWNGGGTNAARGASVWATAAVDAANGFVYAGTGNPASAQHEARNADSILQIDVRRTSATFGKILAVYHGDSESYVDGLRNQPACDNAPDAVKVLDSWSVTCAQLDLDFGASPNLFHTADGHLVVGDLQKSGVYHVVYADTMGGAWKTVIGAPAFAFNGASAAVGDGTVFAAAMPGAVMHALSTQDGRHLWAQPMAGPLHYQSASFANGVTYSTDSYGFLNAWNAANGVPLMKRNLALDTGAQQVNTGSAGVAIARHRLYVAVNSKLVAYGL